MVVGIKKGKPEALSATTETMPKKAYATIRIKTKE